MDDNLNKKRTHGSARNQMTDEPFEIEKGVPIPRSARGAPKYPFADMEIGDSIVGPKAIVSAATAWFHYHGRECTCRRQPDGSYRVWRTA